MFRSNIIFKEILSAIYAVSSVAVGAVAFPTQSFAQTALELPPLSFGPAGVSSGTVAASQAAVVTEFQNEILDAAVLGPGALMLNDGSGLEAGIFPSGRLRRTYHDGYKSLNSPALDTPRFQATEGSAFASGFLVAPSSVLGGQLQLGVFTGYDHIDQKTSAGKSLLLWPGGAEASNESFLYGGYGLYTAGSSYAMLTLSGAEGQTGLSPWSGWPHWSGASYDTHGFIGSAVAGHVIDLSASGGTKDGAGGGAPLKLDLRAGAAYQDFAGDPFLDAAGHRVETSLKNWTGSLSATLFMQIPAEGGASWRPFVKGELRQQLSYDNTVRDAWGFNGVTSIYEFKFDQSDTVGVAELGLDYALPCVTFSAAAYGELASDRDTYGARIGAKFKLH